MEKGTKICRTCLSQKSDMYSLFTYIKYKSNNIDVNYASMLSSFSIRVTADDGFPDHICRACARALNIAHTFKQQCEESDVWLRKHVITIPGLKVIQGSLVNTTKKAENVIRIPRLKAIQGSLVNTTKKAENVITITNDNLQIFELKQSFNPAVMTDNTLCKLEIKDPSENNHSSSIPEDVPAKNNEKRPKFSEDSKEKADTSYPCSKCDKVFLNKMERYKHKQCHRINMCKLCSRSFRSPHGLSYHMKQHQGIRKFVCDYENCNKSFIIKQALNRHKAQHSTKKNYLCNRCGKTYFSKDALNYHLKDHTGMRPYACPDCGMAFKQMCHLKAHTWHHTGLKPYLCSTCGKRYTTLFHLKNHLASNCGGDVNTAPLVQDEQNTIIMKQEVNNQVETNDEPSVEIEYFNDEEGMMFVIEHITTN